MAVSGVGTGGASSVVQQGKAGSAKADGASELLKGDKAEKSEGAAKGKAAKAAQAWAEAGSARSASGIPKEAAKVTLSDKARELSKSKAAEEKETAALKGQESRIREGLGEVPDIREDKVAHYKGLIESGAYKPDAQQIVEGMAREAMKDEVAHG